MLNAPFKLFEKIDNFRSTIGSNNLFLEIGSDRGSGSSFYLQALAKDTGNDFITVDVDPVYLNPIIKSYTMRGEDFVSQIVPTLKEKISLVFMDGFDWTDMPTAVRRGTQTAEVYNLILLSS